MKSTYKAAVVTIMVMILMANPALLAWGNPPPGRWEKAAETNPGDKFTIHLKDGVKRECLYQSIDGDCLACINKYDEKLQFELSTIDKVLLNRSKQTAKKWALWGAAGGAAGMLAFGYVLTTCADAEWANPPVGQIGAACMGAGIGALGGYLAGAAAGAPGETVYISKELAQAEAK